MKFFEKIPMPFVLSFSKNGTKGRVKNVLQYRKRKRITTTVLVMLLLGAVTCILSNRSVEKATEKADKVIGRVASDKSYSKGSDNVGDREGMSAIVVDQDGNIIGTRGGGEIFRLYLVYKNYLKNGENIMVTGEGETQEDSRPFRIESHAFSTCHNLREIIADPENGAWDKLEYLAEDAFTGCSEDLIVYCEKGSYLQERLEEIGITWKEYRREDWFPDNNDMTAEEAADAYMITTEDGRQEDITGDYMVMTEDGLLPGYMQCTEIMDYFMACYTHSLPSEATEIGDGLFNNWSFSSLVIQAGIERIGDNAFASSGIEEIYFGTYDRDSSLKEIGANAFAMTKISDIKLPDGLERIGERAFLGDINLTEITIPASVQEVGDDCFAASGIQKVVVLGADTTFGSRVFSNVYQKDQYAENLTIYGPKDSKIKKYAKKHGIDFIELPSEDETE